MIAVLLCAGFATRMYPLTRNNPKPLLSAAGRPVIDHLMQQIITFPELTAVHVATNHRFVGHFEAWAEQWRPDLKAQAIDLIVHDDGAASNQTRLGAAGDLQFVIKKLGGAKAAFVSAGDNIYCFPIKPLWNRFRRRGRSHIVALPETDMKKLQKTGVPVFGEADRVLRLYEKPQSPPAQWCSPPLYFFTASVWPILDRFLQTDLNHDAPGHFIDYLAQHDSVYGFKRQARRLDVGSLEAYRQVDRLLTDRPELLLFDNEE